MFVDIEWWSIDKWTIIPFIADMRLQVSSKTALSLGKYYVGRSLEHK
jgi:hypothetical protein